MDSTIQFLSAYWLWLLPVVWSYIIWWFVSNKTINSVSIVDTDSTSHNHYYHPFAHQLITEQKEKTDKKTYKFWMEATFWWQSLAISCLIIALAEPVLIGERLPDPPPERDIVFLVDTSISMQLKDYFLKDEPIKRMDLLKKLLDNFATRMEGEHISVIVFAEQPYILVPLSNDQYLIKRMLSRVTTTLAGRYTALGDALLMALKEANKQGDRHQTFIVFTDADESRGQVDSIAAARLVAERDIPIFAIAIGSSQKAENKEVQGGLYQAVNISLLKEITDVTGGNTYQVHDGQAIKNALDEILSQRQNLAKVKPQYEQEILYQYPLLLGLLLLIAFQLIRVFRSELR